LVHTVSLNLVVSYGFLEIFQQLSVYIYTGISSKTKNTTFKHHNESFGWKLHLPPFNSIDWEDAGINQPQTKVFT
jgi:hypothetical protein